MTIFDPNTLDIDKKLQKIEDEEIKSFMKKLGYSDEEIQLSTRKTHLLTVIGNLEEKLCTKEEIIDILVKDG